MQRETVAVLDCGAQYAHLIVQGVRSLGVYSKIYAPDVSKHTLENVNAIIISGSKYSVYDPDAPRVDTEILDMGIPVLGICYGQQLINQSLGGEVVRGMKGEYNQRFLNVLDKGDFFQGMGDREKVLMSHRDVVIKPALGHERIGYTQDSKYAALKNLEKKIFSTQFHVEVDDTPHGMEMLSNFLNFAGCKQNWDPGNLVDEKINYIREYVGNRDAVVFVSGGKDSTTTAILAKMALPKERLTFINFEHGLGRENERKNVEFLFNREIGIDNLFVYECSDLFLSSLEGIIDPQQKRKIISKDFDEATKSALKEYGIKLSENFVIIQGDLYPDRVESGATSKHAAVIKTHHNVGEVFRELEKQHRLCAPLAEFYKVDSIKLGRKVGTPEHVLNDQPFPGPGAAVRIMCTEENFVSPNLEKINELANQISQRSHMNANVLPITSVGVKGDERSDAYPCLLDGPYNRGVLSRLSKSIPSIDEINRVLFSVYPETVSKIKALAGRFVTRERIREWKRYDFAVSEELKNYETGVTQCPVVLVPLTINGSGEMAIIRPVKSRDYMTYRPLWLKKKIIDEMKKRIHEIDDAFGRKRSAVAEDGTGKPTGTTEWQ